jgi:hypothetical protein
VIQIKKKRWARLVRSTGERGGLYRILVRKPEGKRLLGKSRRRWEDNIKIYFQEVGWGHRLDWCGSG